MTDSETDERQSNMFTFQDQNSNTMIYAKGPNIYSNISNTSSRNNMLTSSVNMPWNLDRRRYAQSVYDQRSIYQRRGTSPMSLHSASGFQPRNFHHLHQRDGISSHRSTYNGKRSDSPMSMRTLDSNTSVITSDIVSAFKTASFNKYDLRKIKDAYNKFMKHRFRQRVEKRRRRFLKGFRRKSGGDSGHQASDSSLSSDDNRSTRSTRSRIYKDNASSSRSTRTNIIDIRTIRDSSMYKDCTKNFGSLRNLSSFPSTSVNDNKLSDRQPNALFITQKDRFKNGFVLPSQRFNQSIASQSVAEHPSRLQINDEKNMNCQKGASKKRRQQRNIDTDSEEEQIFSEVANIEKSSFKGDKSQAKRGLDDDDLRVSVQKKTKLSSPPNSNHKTKTSISKQNMEKTSISKDGAKSKDFEFAKPKFPIRKQGNAQNQQKSILSSPRQNILKPNLITQPTETLISKSLQQLNDFMPASSTLQPKETFTLTKPPIVPFTKQLDQPVEQLISNSLQPLDALDHPLQVPKWCQNNIYNEKEQCEASEITQVSTTNLSMRPSFIKRKLFTQKVDVADNKNASSNSVEADSPQSNIYSDIIKEKHKTRKLVTSQSCLNRDVLRDESNFLDLIHKIVPADQMNLTTATNRTEIHKNRSKPVHAADRWDVSTVISTCKDGEESDTYTDEEIFQVNENVAVNKTKPKKQKNTHNESNQHKANKTPKHNLLHNKNMDNNANKQKSFVKENELNVVTQSKPKSTKVKEQNIAKINNNEPVQKKQPSQCVIVVEKLQPHNLNKSLKAANAPELHENEVNKCYKSVKSFWDTDIESEFEMQDTPNHRNRKAYKQKDTQLQNNSVEVMKNKLIKKKGNIENIAPVTNSTEVKNTKTNTNKNSAINGKVKVPDMCKSADFPKPGQKATKSIKNNVTINETIKPKQNDISLMKKSNKKTTLDSANVTRNTDKEKPLTINDKNNTLRLRLRRTPKIINKCCDETQKSVNGSSEIYSTRLRSRERDLSTSLRSSASSASRNNNKVKNKLISKKITSTDNGIKDNSLLSDMSFTLTLETPMVKRLAANRRLTKLKNNGASQDTSKTPQSDVSFTLRSGKSLNPTQTRKRLLRATNNSKFSISREGDSLHISTPVHSRSKRTPPIKQPQIPKNSSRLNRSK